MELIKDTIQNVIKKLETRRGVLPEDNLEIFLKKILTKKELGHIKLNYCRKGILCLKVDSSSWLYHLSLQKEDLLARLRKKDNTIKDIRFCIGD
jgi:hypothetical protein